MSDATHNPPTDFKQYSACPEVQQKPVGQALFLVSGEQIQALIDLQEQPEQPNKGLQDLFARKPPWTEA